MSQAAGVPHVRMLDEDEENADNNGDRHDVGDQAIDIDAEDSVTSSGIRTPPSERHDGQPPLALMLGNSPHITAVVSPSVSALSRRNIMQKRGKIMTVLLSALCLVGVSFAAARSYYYKPPDSSDVTVMSSSFETGNGSGNSEIGGTTTSASSLDSSGFDFSSSFDEAGDSTQPGFLKFHMQDSGSSVFELGKALWNASFIVYPTIARHAAPQAFSFERGSSLVETTDHVFHFEKPSDGSYNLILVQDYTHAALGEASEELRAIFDDSQWAGHLITIPIYMETEDSYFIPTDPFLGSGFFVSSLLALAADYTPVAGSAASYPRNAVFQVEYNTQAGIVIVNFAIGVLPDQVMPQRVSDDRVGYFGIQYTRFGMPEAVTAKDGFHYYDSRMQVINRRRLEVDLETGMVKEPITYYIDPSVPSRWRKAFAAGVEAWKPAFERIGFVGAIKAVLPGDADWPEDYRLGDLRYNTISVMISEVTYALGPFVMDPRSGEILHSDIIFEYGFFNDAVSDFDLFSPVDPPERSVVEPVEDSEPAINGPSAADNTKTAPFASHRRQSSRTHPSQCGLAHDSMHAMDRFEIGMLLLGGQPSGSGNYVPDSIVAQHFTDTVMHEVGHTLGLRHNFVASAAFSREQLNDPAFVKQNGVASSVMDYVPANIFSDLTPEAAATHEFYSSTIGPYDFAAIAYGYSPVADEVPGEKSPTLTALAESTPLFLTDEAVEMDTNPYAQRFDLSDPVDFALDRLQFVEQARNSTWLADKIPEDAPAYVLWRRESMLLRMVNASVAAARPMLGGVNATHAHLHAGQAPHKTPFLPRETQLRALAVLARVIAADGDNSALFPSPSDYSEFMQDAGFMDEDCSAPSLIYSCLGRGLVDVDAVVMGIRKGAVVAALFPAIERIVAQDAASPLSLEDLLLAVETAAMSADLAKPRNQAVLAYYHDLLQAIVDLPAADSRVTSVISAMYPQISPAPVVRNKVLLRGIQY